MDVKEQALELQCVLDSTPARTCVGAFDPGLDGAIAFRFSDGMTEAHRMPVIKKGSSKRILDIPKIRELLIRKDPQFVVIEKQQPMRRGDRVQGTASTGTSMMNYGILIGLCGALEIRYDPYVTPQFWKGKILRGTAKDKMAAIDYCQRMHPEVDLCPGHCKKPHDGIADAVCISDYCWQYYSVLVECD